MANGFRSNSLTVGEVIRRVFPNGTLSPDQVVAPSDNASSEKIRARNDLSDCLHCPDYPPDVFAIAAHLLQLAGAYHHFAPCADVSPAPTGCLTLADVEITLFESLGEKWMQEPKAPIEVQEKWTSLLAHKDDRVYLGTDPARLPAAWWEVAMCLLIASDEACEGVGFSEIEGQQVLGPSQTSWIADLEVRASKTEFKKAMVADEPHVKLRPGRSSLSAMTDEDVVCVQPKSRTPDVGCTVRTLSHNVAVLPPRGVMRAHWVRPPNAKLGREAESKVNLLLVPFPYTMDKSCFHGEVVRPSIKSTGFNTPSQNGIGWFEIDQKWLPEEGRESDFIEYFSALYEAALEKEHFIHGVILPEMALNWRVYEVLAEFIRRDTYAEFLVAGSSSNCDGQKGNFVLSSQFYQDASGVRRMTSTSRPKHHRWRINTGQLTQYGLTEILDSNIDYWERIELRQREIHVGLLRAESTFTTMICEDLARSDPCHEILRALGPNVVFVLLMDGPQSAQRWAGRYSLALADDPGSSVLTLTSRALVQLTNENRNQKLYPKNNWNIGLWRDDKGGVVELDCPPTYQALILPVWAQAELEKTLDARVGTKSWAWRGAGKAQKVAIQRSKVTPMVKRIIGTS